MIAEFRDYLKTLNVAQHYSIGKIDNSKDYSLGVYPDSYLPRVESIGKMSSYGTYGFRILLHWNKNAKQAEENAIKLFEAIRYITDLDMGSIHVQYIDLTYDQPQSVGTDENGVYEYVISGTIYYRKDQINGNN